MVRQPSYDPEFPPSRMEWEINRGWIAAFPGWKDRLKEFLDDARQIGLTRVYVKAVGESRVYVTAEAPL